MVVVVEDVWIPSRNLGNSVSCRNFMDGHLVPPTSVTWGGKGTLASGCWEKEVIIWERCELALSCGEGSNHSEMLNGEVSSLYLMSCVSGALNAAVNEVALAVVVLLPEDLRKGEDRSKADFDAEVVAISAAPKALF